MAKLNQIVAVTKGKKSEAKRELTDLYKKLGSDIFSGLARNYEPKDDDGETFPSESKAVQFTSNKALEEAADILTELFDVVATQDYSNCSAFADVKVDGEVLLEKVPVTYLMFLEKQLTDVNTFVSSLPELDPSVRWTFDETRGEYVSDEVETNKTKKVFRNHVKAEATDKHPAQVEVYSEDEVVGSWKTRKFSGAISPVEKRNILERVKTLQEGVKFAREEANSIDAKDEKVGASIFDYLFQ